MDLKSRKPKLLELERQLALDDTDKLRKPELVKAILTLEAEDDEVLECLDAIEDRETAKRQAEEEERERKELERREQKEREERERKEQKEKDERERKEQIEKEESERRERDKKGERESKEREEIEELALKEQREKEEAERKEREEKEELASKEQLEKKLQELRCELKWLKWQSVRDRLKNLRRRENFRPFLKHFEEVYMEDQVDKDDWSVRLLVFLPTDISTLLARLSDEHAYNYEKAKNALFRYFGIRVETGSKGQNDGSWQRSDQGVSDQPRKPVWSAEDRKKGEFGSTLERPKFTPRMKEHERGADAGESSPTECKETAVAKAERRKRFEAMQSRLCYTCQKPGQFWAQCSERKTKEVAQEGGSEPISHRTDGTRKLLASGRLVSDNCEKVEGQLSRNERYCESSDRKGEAPGKAQR